jgi:hypothetical protein
MLPASELAQIRKDLETTLPDSGTVLTLASTSDGQGGWSEVWSGSTPIPCRLDFISGAETPTGAALTPYTRAIVTIPQDTTISEQNRFGHSSGTYTIQAVNLGSWLGVKRLTVEKV